MADVNPHTDTIIHIGAGQGSELEAYLATEARRIILVEPNPTLAVQLRGKAQQYPRVEVLELAITDNPAHNTLYEYNLPEASGLYLADGLKALFPGLRQITQYAVATQTPQGLVQGCQLQGENNNLVVQASGAELAIVNALIKSGKISHFRQLEITSSEHPVFNRDGDAERLKQTLQNEGFELKAKDSHNPDWPVWTYVSSPVARQLKSVMQKNQVMTDTLALKQQELEDNSASLAEVRSELEQARAKHEEERAAWEHTKNDLSAQLTKAQEQAKQAQAERDKLQEKLNTEREAGEQLELETTKLKKQNSEQTKNLEEAKAGYAKDLQLWEQKTQELSDQLEKAKQNKEQQKKEHAKQINALEEQLAAARAGKEQFNELKKRMDYLFGQQTLQLEQAANALGRHVTSTVTSTAKDLEAGIALQQQYGQDLPNLEDQSGRLPASVALQLSRELKTQPYDVIIELGSGVTTTFMAHTLRNHTSKNDEQRSSETQVANYVDASEDDLPKRIVCFEHNRTTYNKLLETLKASGLAPLINVHYAPLVATSYQGQERLFYDCANTLQRIATLFEGRQARIFILVNVPQGASQPDIAAALPQVLQHLAAHTLDVVVNTHGRNDLISQWHRLLDERGLEYQQAVPFGNAFVRRLKVNP